MKHNIIQTKNYLLVVDDKKTIANWYYNESEGKVDSIEFTPTVIGGTIVHNIKAHLPLNNSPILEGVDLLPPLEDEVDKLSADYTEEWCSKRKVDVYIHDAFKAGYNKAKEKYKYTEEDLIKVWKACLDFNKPAGSDSGINFEDFIQSLPKTKLPVAFDCEVERYTVGEMSSLPLGTVNQRLKTTTNSQGITQWVGSYIYK
jgi:hypothetical protein